MPPKPWENDPGFVNGPEWAQLWDGVLPRELEFGIRASVRNRLTIYFRPVDVPSWGGVIPEDWVHRHLPLWLHTQIRPSIFFVARRPTIPALEELGFRHASELSQIVIAPPLSPGLAREVVGEGPYPLLTRTLEVMIRYNRFTAQEVVGHVMPLVSGVEREVVDAAVAVVLHDTRFVGRSEGGVIRWEPREPTSIFDSISNTRISEHLDELFPGVSPEEVAAGWRPNPAAPPGDYINIEAGPPSGEFLLELLEGARIPPASGRGPIEVDGSGYATLGSELRDLVWGPGFAEFLTSVEIHNRLAGRRFWPVDRVNEALESGFRSGVLERVVQGGVVVGYRPIITGNLRPTALERIVKGGPDL
jgi:hypothetical protein